jgi:hypothetical protein
LVRLLPQIDNRRVFVRELLFQATGIGLRRLRGHRLLNGRQQHAEDDENNGDGQAPLKSIMPLEQWIILQVIANRTGLARACVAVAMFTIISGSFTGKPINRAQSRGIH